MVSTAEPLQGQDSKLLFWVPAAMIKDGQTASGHPPRSPSLLCRLATPARSGRLEAFLLLLLLWVPELSANV